MAAPDAALDGPVDRWGGWREVTLGATGRFRLQEWRGGWWFVTPVSAATLEAGLQPPPGSWRAEARR